MTSLIMCPAGSERIRCACSRTSSADRVRSCPAPPPGPAVSTTANLPNRPAAGRPCGPHRHPKPRRQLGIAHWRMQARCTPAKAPRALASTSPPALTMTAWICRCQAIAARRSSLPGPSPGPPGIIFRRYPWNCCCPTQATSPASRNRYGQQGVSPRSPRGTVGQPGALPRRPLRVKSPQHTVKVAQTLLQQALRPQLTTGVVPNPRTSGTPGPEGCTRAILT